MNDLRGPYTGSLFSTDLIEALADERTHVAVVLNTVDDRLGKEQKLGAGAWRIKKLSGLESLLRAARADGNRPDHVRPRIRDQTARQPGRCVRWHRLLGTPSPAR